MPVVIDGETESVLGIYVDISDRKNMEDRLKKSLREKEVLLAEIYHRVKNNLAVITGLLELQGNSTQSEETALALSKSQMRINSIALIHEKLYQTEDLSRILFDEYVRELAVLILDLLADDFRQVEVQVDAEPIILSINEAIPCGLIINELVTNAYKHAFDERSVGLIKIYLHQTGDNIVLRVQDNGKGLPDEVDIDRPKTLGIKLIRTLSKQLKASCRFQNLEKGVQFDLSFPLV